MKKIILVSSLFCVGFLVGGSCSSPFVFPKIQYADIFHYLMNPERLDQFVRDQVSSLQNPSKKDIQLFVNRLEIMNDDLNLDQIAPIIFSEIQKQRRERNP